MNTISIIAIIVAVFYSLIVGKMAGNYRNSIKREYDAKRKEQGLRAISRDIYIEMLKDQIKQQNQKIKQLTPRNEN